MRQGVQLDPATFKEVIRNAPLISIDLIVRNGEDEYLLGQRRNAPAQGKWFVPGGRIYKNEILEQALKRVIHEELGLEGVLTPPKFLGVFDHIYDDNVFGDSSFGTHYVVLAHALDFDLSLTQLPVVQHREYRWWSREDILTSSDVHMFTQAYFK